MKVFVSAAAFIFVLAISSCANSHWLSKEAIPADVIKPGYTLLILKLDEAESKQKYQQFTNQKLEKLLKDYPYSVELVTKEQLNSPQYADVRKYRYVLRATNRTQSTTYKETYKPSPNSNQVRETSTKYDYSEQVFTDRQENKDYPYSDYRVVRFDQGVKTILQYIRNGK